MNGLGVNVKKRLKFDLCISVLGFLKNWFKENLLINVILIEIARLVKIVELLEIGKIVEIGKTF
jgi:hypothetical protein